ncbi:MAG: response regulator [Spirochaetales bacterium]|nr:response regulator [Spirochaetales bacterium]
MKMDLRNSGRVLIMDDEVLVRDVARKMLERLGYKVTEAHDGKEVIRIFTESLPHQNKFDLVIMDLTIPGGLGGDVTIKELRKINPEVKVIVASGYSNHPIMTDYKKFGFDGIVEKPFKLNELESILKGVLFSPE